LRINSKTDYFQKNIKNKNKNKANEKQEMGRFFVKKFGKKSTKFF
jgi:hypothetical protein